MPYIPRSMAPSGLTDPSLVPRSSKKSTKKSAVPYQGKPKDPQKERGNPMTNKLSMKDWDVDPMKVLNQITGKEHAADEHSGMVS